MSYTKELKKRLPKMTQADKECLQFALDKKLDRESNPMIRSSLKERIAMLNRSLGKCYPGQTWQIY